jgi:hypothetical protein
MAEPEFSATGVRIGRRLSSLTRAGQVLIRDGRLVLLTSRGREIDSAPVEDVHAIRTPFSLRRRALATVNGTGYLLTLRRQGAASVSRFLEALDQARQQVVQH